MSATDRIFLGVALGVVITTVLLGCTGKNDSVSQAEKSEKDRPSIAETKAIAEEGFIYGLPVVMNYAVMYEYAVDRNSGQFKAPFNQINNEARVFTNKDTAIITPNSDTPYSLLWLDLRAEPMVLSVPAVPTVALLLRHALRRQHLQLRLHRHPRHGTWCGRLSRGWSRLERRNAFGHQKSVSFHYAILAGGLPHATLQPCRHAQCGQGSGGLQSAATLLIFEAAGAAGAAGDQFPKDRQDMVKTNFFEYLDFALQFAPPGPDEKDIRAKLARIGVGAGKTFDFKDLSPEHKAAVLLAMKEGDDKVDKYLVAGQKNINGWKVGSLFGDAAFYNGDWLKRAAAAKGGIYGNDAVEAMYPLTKTLANGAALDGSKHNYTLTFAKDQFPPVNAFWSVTMYDGKTQLLIENPINRYLINSPMLPSMKKNADGSLTLYIQKDSPGKDEGI